MRVVARLLILLSAIAAVPAAGAPVILAAASLREGMSAVADSWAARGHARPRLVFAGTQALARQLAAGAPADLFVSADEDWPARLLARSVLRPGSVEPFLSNRLVVVVPAGDRRPLVRLGDLPARIAGGRLAVADAAVPAGRYAREALRRVDLWSRLEPRVAGSDNVRGTLMLVARGVAPAGFVYATDAAAEPRVRVAGRVAERLHAPIRYMVATPRAARDPDAAAFRAFLLSPAGRRPFLSLGFLTPR